MQLFNLRGSGLLVSRVVVLIITSSMVISPLEVFAASSTTTTATASSSASSQTTTSSNTSSGNTSSNGKTTTSGSSKATGSTQTISAMAQSQGSGSGAPTIGGSNIFTFQPTIPKIDGNTGALTQDIPIDIPPGRNGVQPDLRLQYNSQNPRDGIVGYGWNISIPYIQRLNKTGSQNLYGSNPYFTSSFDGELANVGTTISASQYMARVDDGSFRQYTYATSTDSWTMYDKKGTEYLFGSSDQSKENAATNSTTTYKWMLEKIVDTNGNYVRFVYSKDSHQLYPSQIIYTGNGSTDGPFTVSFATSTRPDPIIDYMPGFKVTTNFRISQITASVGSNWVRKYALSYATGNNGYRSLLSSIQETGQDDSNNQVTLPAMTFNYVSSSTPFVSHGQQGHGWVYADADGNGTNDSTVFYLNGVDGYLHGTVCPDNNSPGCSGPSQTPSYWATTQNSGDPYPPTETGTRFIDLNGSGKAAVVQGVYNYTTSSSTNQLYANTYATSTGYAWVATTTWQGNIPPFELTGSGSATSMSTGILGDVNGDGLPDYELRLDGQGLPTTAYLGNGTAFDATTTIFNPPISMPDFTPPNNSQLVDVTGDGLQDWVYSDNNNNYVLLNTGTGWESSPSSQWTIATSTLYSTSTNQGVYFDRGIRFLDVNGDGLPDLVRSYCATNPTDGSENGTYGWVMYNTGSGWAPPVPYTLPSCITSWSSGIGQTYNEYANFRGNGQQIQDIISKVNYSQGGSSDISYGLSTQLPGAGGNNLPYDVAVVTKIVNHDGLGSNEETDYSYAGGQQYLPANIRDRKFAGFATVTETHPDATITTYYDQGDGINSGLGEQSDGYAQINHPFRIDQMTPQGKLVRKTLNRWDTIPHGNSTFVGLGDQLVQDFASDGSHQDKDTSYAYSTTTDDLLEMDEKNVASGDIRSTTYTYALNNANNLSALIEKKISDATSTTSYATWTAASILVVAGGGGGAGGLSGGSQDAGGGGGAGGYVYNPTYSVSSQAYTVTVGNGGAGGVAGLYGANGTQGQSSIFGTLTAIGGGGGAACSGNGGSGGGGTGGCSGGTGTTGQGHNGGNGPGTVNGGGGGGGGAGSVGTNATANNTSGAFGGSGTGNSIGGTLVTYAVGGKGGNTSDGNGLNGTANTGNGGNGSGLSGSGGSGGSGIVIVSAPTGAITASGGTHTVSGGNDIWIFNSNGNWTVTGINIPIITIVPLATSSDEQYLYDNLPFGAVSNGNMTQQKDWISGSAYASSTKSYTSYGLVATSTDPVGDVTTLKYDTYNLYPATSTNAKSQSTSYIYNYSNGKPKQVIDPNGLVFQTVYDGVGRVTQQLQPDLTTPSTLDTKATYTYLTGSVPQSIQETDYFSSTSTHNLYTYIDGLGRTIQTRTQTENSGTDATKDTQYTARGDVARSSLPYFSSGNAWTTPTTTAALFTTYTYDPLDRPLTITTSVGVTTNAYNAWKVTTTDPKGNAKDYSKDAFGNLIQVNEYNGANTYSTFYTYDMLGDLLKLTDANGNVRNFTYDGLSRRLTAQDLHSASAPTFGTYTYGYDAAGNLIQKVDPKSQTITYAYDQINRPLTETSASTTQVTYTYDSCTYGIGHLCIASTTAERTTYTYNSLGGKANESLVLAGATTTYATAYNYDRQGNVLTVTNPNGAQINYAYNTGGFINTVNRAVGTSTTPIATLFNYAPTSQIGMVNFASGATTTYTYDPNNLYRLTRILTQSTTTSSGTSTASLLSNLTAYWKLDENNGNASDATGNGYTLTNDNSVGYASGLINNAADFSTANANKILLNGTDLGINGGSISMSTWVKARAAITGSGSGLWILMNQAHAGGNNIQYVIAYDYNGGTPRLRGIRTKWANDTSDENVYYPITLPQTAWTHIVLTYDTNSQALDMYVNGSLVATSTTSGTGINQPYTGTGLGSNIDNGSTYAPASVYEDEAGVWNRALSASEVSLLYNGGSGLRYPFSIVSPSNFQDSNYTYDPDGNITTRTDNSVIGGGQTVNYTYDALNRLTSASTTGATSTSPAYNQTFTYDPLGNILTGPTGTYTYGGTNNADPDAVTQTQLIVGQTAPTIAYDNSTLAGNGVNASSLTFSHTTNATTASSTVIVVGVQESTGGSCASDTVTGVTYNGVTLTDMGYYVSAQANGTALKTYYGFAPAQGTHNVVVTASASCIRYIVATTYSGVKQSGFPDASGTGNPMADSGAVTTLNASTNVSYNAWPVLIGVPAAAATSLANSLTSYYSLDETSGNPVDNTGSGHNLTNNNAVAFSPGRINNAANFGSSNTSKSLSNTTDFTGSGDLSVNMWVNFSALPGSGVLSTPFSIRTSGSSRRFFNFDYRNIGGMYWDLWTGSMGGTEAGYAINESTGSWIMMTLTFSSSNNVLTLYRNGTSIITLSTAGSSGADMTKMVIGNEGYGGRQFLGAIDETGIWGKVLTPAEISQLYNNGNGLSYGSFGGSGTASSTATTTIRQQQTGNLIYADSNAPEPQGASVLALTTPNSTHWSANYFSLPPTVSNLGTTYTTNYSYDANGNLTGTTMGATSTAYTYDYNNRMLSSAGTGLPSLSYIYDPAGNRLAQTGATSTTIYPSKFYSVTQSGNNATSTEYIYAGDILFGTIDQPMVNGVVVGSSTVRFVHTDNLGSTQATSDTHANLVQSFDYAPYGSVIASTNTGTTSPARQFLGQYFDSSSNLDYFQNRYYNPAQGQFVSEDPVFLNIGSPKAEQLANRNLQAILSDPQQLNSYSYAEDNPVTVKDPSGLISSNTATILGLYAQVLSLLSQIVVQLGGGGASNPVSASTAMLAHSTTINPGPLNISQNNQGSYGNVINKIQDSSTFNAYVQNQIDQNGKNGKLNVPSNDPRYSLNFTSGDLHTSLGKANVGLSGTQAPDGSWNIKVNVSDTYNFSLVQDYGSNGSARGITTLNNAAYFAQQAGVVSDYPVSINFNYTYNPQ